MIRRLTDRIRGELSLRLKGHRSYNHVVSIYCQRSKILIAWLLDEIYASKRFAICCLDFSHVSKHFDSRINMRD